MTTKTQQENQILGDRASHPPERTRAGGSRGTYEGRFERIKKAKEGYWEMSVS